MPMGMAEIAEVLWRRFLKHNPADPHWPDRDRFVLSNGHGSMLLYALLHLTGYALPIEELQALPPAAQQDPRTSRGRRDARRRDDHRPARPGLANAVGMALAEKLLAAEFNRPGHTHRRPPHLGVRGRRLPDGGHQPRGLLARRHAGLSKLIAIYDDNGISIDGQVEHWFTDDTPKRFEAYGWRVIRNVDGHDCGGHRGGASRRRASRAAGRR